MLLVDIQGFTVPGFVLKELAVTNGRRTAHYVFRAPHPYTQLGEKEKRQVRWVEKFHHGIRWNTGFTSLKELPCILQRVTFGESIIYCKGLLKVNFLKKYLPDRIKVYNIENDVQFSLKHYIVEPPCFAHDLSTRFCAITTINVMQKYLYNKQVLI